MVRRGDVQHETIEGVLTGIEKWNEANEIEVNGIKYQIADLILDNLPGDVKTDIISKLGYSMIRPSYKIQIFLDLKVKVVRE